MATRDEIYLAALLHDIGKIWQRTVEILEYFKHYKKH